MCFKGCFGFCSIGFVVIFYYTLSNKIAFLLSFFDCVFAYFQCDHFPKLKIDFESRFEMRMFGQYLKKSPKMDFPLYFQKVMLLWQGSIVEIDYGFFRVFGPYFIGKSLGTFKILIFGLWSFIPHPYYFLLKIVYQPI